MNFADKDILKLFILVIPIFIYLIYRILIIFNNFNKFFDKKLLGKIFYNVSFVTIFLKYLLIIISLVLFIIAAARPLGKPIETEQQYSGRDIMIVLDVSSSMNAIDLKPNRIEVVKKGLHDFLTKLSGDRVGIIVFAGIDFVQCPLTLDYEAVSFIIDSIYAGMLPKEGTALGNAIQSAIERMEEKAEKSKVMILITDGESLEGISPIDASKIAKEKNIRIYTLGVGTEEGGMIPEGEDIWGRTYYKSYRGEIVISRLDEKILKQIAGITDGKYFRVTDINAFNKIMNDIKEIEANKAKIKKETKYEENYWIFLLWGIILFMIAHIIPTGKI
ncbi:MAG: VWA domain-containing protein [Candidatus Goldbacteria bacterium]|nr:VWA domain-containing protein [Candidatus Goldiibacteriota bacterium]